MLLDSLIALRIMYLLVMPFRKWPACKQGIIDDEGNLITAKKKSSDWTMLHKMVAKLKRFIQLAPGGKSVIASLIGAYMLVKEQYETDSEYMEEEILYRYDMIMNSLTEEQLNEGTALLEEIGSGVAIAAGTAPDKNDNVEPTVKRVKNKYTDRNMMFRRQSFKEFVSDSK